jgi:tetratricopeptide (TPR) repeat protein
MTLERDSSLETITQLADVLAAQGRPAEAERVLRDRAVAQPNEPAVLAKLGTLLWRSGKYEEAIDTYRTAAQLARGPEDPRFIESKVDEAVSLLSLARWDEGWEAYRWRYDRKASKATYPQLIDDPSKIANGTTPLRIRLHTDQGIGDELFFLRFAGGVRAMGHRLLLLTGRKQLPLLSALTDLLDVVQPADTTGAAPCDVALLCSDLPLVTREVLPAPLRLRPEPERLGRLQAQLRIFGPPPYVGVTWRAGPTLEEQVGGRLTWVYSKQVPPEELAAVLRPLRATVVVLQRRISEGERSRFQKALGREALDLSGVHEELPDALAALSLLDEYIGVSSTNMHLLAGVEGKRARVLVKHPAEWRWGLEGDSSPWFPGFYVYRQTPDRSWARAFRELAADLRPLVA